MYADLTYSKDEVAEAIGCSTKTIERLVARNEFPRPITLGTRVFWKRIDIETFINDANANMRIYREIRRDSKSKNS